MKNFILRLDDACPKRDIEKWNKIEILLDKYQIKPLVGIIPNCMDTDMEKYNFDSDFWKIRVNTWKKKNWVLALHGYNHVFETTDGGLNPVNKKSEFAGVTFERQVEKIQQGVDVFKNYNIEPQVFFAPAHTFDLNTIKALKQESNIKIISDTPANYIYSQYGMTFVPQQSGHVRNLPFKLTTFCYHPNTMTSEDFDRLEKFIIKYKKNFIDFPIELSKRQLSLFDKIVKKLYFWRHK